jgi:conserved oligomeric Golgi complex subunit 2
MPSSMTRASTPVPPSENASTESSAADDGLLRQFAAAMVDIKIMHEQALTYFRERIDIMSPDTSGLADGDEIRVEG